MILLPNIFKHFMKPRASSYIFPDASELKTEEEPEPVPELEEEEAPLIPTEILPEPEPEPEKTAIDFAQAQAEAILAQANQDAEEIREKARRDAEAEIQQLRQQARQDGYNAGFTEGMANAMAEGRAECEKQAAQQAEEVKQFLDSAARIRDEIYEEHHAGMRDLALAIAEKVIRISLKSSGDILMRMIESATEKHRRCEWVQIYIAGCDAKTMSYTIPELNAALVHLSDRVRIIPMADDESGTCIIEMPDEIIDASVSTQIDNIQEILNAAADRN